MFIVQNKLVSLFFIKKEKQFQIKNVMYFCLICILTVYRYNVINDQIISFRQSFYYQSLYFNHWYRRKRDFLMIKLNLKSRICTSKMYWCCLKTEIPKLDSIKRKSYLNRATYKTEMKIFQFLPFHLFYW